MKFLSLTLQQPERLQHPMQKYIAENENADCARLIHARYPQNSHQQEDHEILFFQVEADRSPYVAALDATDTVLEYDITPIDADSFYVFIRHQVRRSDRKFRAEIDGESLMLVPPVEYRADGIMQYQIIGNPDDLRGVIKEMPADVEVSIDRLGDYDTHRRWDQKLSERQCDAVAAAVKVGYYDMPRTAGLATVADELNCASSTASDHLMKAEETIMKQLVSESGFLFSANNYS